MGVPYRKPIDAAGAWPRAARRRQLPLVPTLRIVVWNCRGRVHEKTALLRSLRPDVAVLPECACPEVLLRRAIDLERCSFAWDGARPDRGLAVVAFPPWSLALDGAHRPRAGTTLPVRLCGPAQLRLLAVWALPSWAHGRHKPAPEPLSAAVARLDPFTAKWPVIVAGDFNDTLITRRLDGTRGRSRLARTLARRGLVSAWHHHCLARSGMEHEPTFFRLRRFASPHQLDHVFVDRQSAAGLREVRLFGGARWMVWSDHVPLVAELDV